MVRKKKNKDGFNILNAIIGVLILVIIGIVSFQAFSISGEEAFLPEYWTAECVERAESMSFNQVTSHSDTGKFYECTSDFTGVWIPEVNGVQCEYETDAFATTSYVCDLDANNVDDNSCVKQSGFFTSAIREKFVIDVNQKIWIDTDDPGTGELFTRYPSYGLRVRLQDGFVEATTTDCIANSIEDVTEKQAHPLNLNGRLVVVPGSPFNAVTGSKRAISTQLVNLDNVEGGDTIYISRPGYYFKTDRAEDDFLFVNTKREYQNGNIECIPRTSGCSDDAKIVRLEDQSCDANSGAVVSYSPVEGDTSRLCKYDCNGGSLDLTSDCISVQASCPESQPLWDAKTGECVRVSEAPGDEGNVDLFIVYILIGTLASLVILIGIKYVMDGRKRK